MRLNEQVAAGNKRLRRWKSMNARVSDQNLHTFQSKEEEKEKELIMQMKTAHDQSRGQLAGIRP